ncbi:MAG: DUF6798 domain-containing protein [Armatimonadota bacterium]|nr:DUF6798 domain-containing protein [Armatimonadota bacterium]
MVTKTTNPAGLSIGWSLILAAAFAAAYGFTPLYHANQNQYFFHGLAQAGVGILRADWLAGTIEVWPIFTQLVRFTIVFLHPGAFHLYYGGLVALYAYSLLGIAARLPGWRGGATASLLFLASVTVLHSPVVAAWSIWLLGANLPGQLVRGVALQELLGGGMLQPATFGVLLVFSVYLFLRNQPTAAAVAAAAAAAVHPAYLVTSAVLIAAYVLILIRRPTERRAAAVVLAVAGALLAPVAAFAALNFGPSDPDAWRLSRQILVEFRFPHHAVVGRWLGPMVFVKLAVVVAAIVLVHRADLAWIMGLWAAAAVGLTVMQLTSGSQALAVLFPWRISVVLVPLATAVVVARLSAAAAEMLTARPGLAVGARSVAVLAMIFLAAGGVSDTWARTLEHRRDDRADLFAFVRKTALSSHLYMIPSRWDAFRLSTGAPTFVDFEFIPYEDKAVLEWYRRLGLSEAFYRHSQADRCRLAGFLSSDYGITHVVAPVEMAACPGWVVLYEDERYRLYGLPSSGPEREKERGRERSP